jgi:hypothetical protein
MPYRAVESAAAADSLATSALPLDFDVACLAFGKKFRRALCFEPGEDRTAFAVQCGVFSNSTMMVSVDVLRVNSSPIFGHAKIPI